MDERLQPPAWKIVLKKIWPYINRGINVSVYFVFHLIINGIKTAIQQIKGSF